MMPRVFSSTSVRTSALAFLLALALLGWSLVGAMFADRTEGRPIPAPIASLATIHRADTTSDDLEQDAIDHDPFSPARERPSVRYGTPAAPVVLNAAPIAPAVLHLVGTVVAPENGSFVVAQLGDTSPKVLHVGQRVGEFTLRSITQGAATFVKGNGERLELRVPKNGS